MKLFYIFVYVISIVTTEETSSDYDDDYDYEDYDFEDMDYDTLKEIEKTLSRYCKKYQQSTLIILTINYVLLQVWKVYQIQRHLWIWTYLKKKRMR